MLGLEQMIKESRRQTKKEKIEDIQRKKEEKRQTDRK